MGSSAFTGLGEGNAGLKRLVRQNNTFAVGDVLRLDNGGTYVTALADSVANSEVVGVVEDRTSTSFTLVYSGEIDLTTWGEGIAEGQAYFLQKVYNDGNLDTQPPSASGTIKKTVLIGGTNNRGVVVNMLGLVNGVDSDDLVDLEGIQPVGTVIPYAGPISTAGDLPDGWLMCDGSQFSSVTYPELALLLGETYGTISANLYTLPDLRARTPIGLNTTIAGVIEKSVDFGNYTIGSNGGQETVALGETEIPMHYHDMQMEVFMDDVMVDNYQGPHESIDGATYSYSGGVAETNQIDSQGPVIGDDWGTLSDDGDFALVDWGKTDGVVCGKHHSSAGQAHDNLQPYLTLNYIIRAKKQASAAILTVNIQDLADVDNSHSCNSYCVNDTCHTPRQGDSLVFNGSKSNNGELNVGHGTDKFVVTSTSNYDKNSIINGNFDIWQRDTSFSSEEVNTAGRLWLADMWNFGKHSSTSSKHTISKGGGDTDISKSPWDMGASSVPGKNFLEVYTTVPKSEMSSADYVHLNYFIEGHDMRPLWGAKCMTLSFFVRGKTVGTYSVAFRNKAFTMSFVSEYTISQANKWEWKTITVPIPEWGERDSWNFGNDTGMRISWTIAGGTNHQTSTINSWLVGSNVIQSNNQVNGVSQMDTTTEKTFQISQVQLESGSVATPFQQMRLQDEIARCERYYEKSYELATVPGTATSRGRINENDWVISPTAHISTTFRTRKMATPTVTIYNPTDGVKGSYNMTHMESGSDANHFVTSTYASETNIYSITRDTSLSTLNSGYKNKIAFHYVSESPLG